MKKIILILVVVVVLIFSGCKYGTVNAGNAHKHIPPGALVEEDLGNGYIIYSWRENEYLYHFYLKMNFNGQYSCESTTKLSD